MSQPIGRVLTAHARRTPSTPAVTCGTESLTWQELDLHTNRLGRAYQQLGVSQGSLVTIALPNSVEFFAACIAAWKIGAVPQPVSARLPLYERQAIVDLAQPALVVGADVYEHPGHKVLPADSAPDAALSNEPLPDAISPSWKAPTSGGSTGLPKLIKSTENGVVDLTGQELSLYGRNGCYVIPGPLFHNFPFTGAMRGLFFGNHIVAMPRFDAQETLALIQKHQATLVSFVPTMMLRIWRLPEHVRAQYDVASVRAWWHSAAPCPDWLKDAWIGWVGGDRIYELYGGTENQAYCVIRGDEWLVRRGSVGRPFAGEMKVSNADGNTMPPGGEGEIYMRSGPNGAATYTYVGAEPRTLGDGWESLGDIGRMDEDGYVYITDRRTDMILVGGENVFPAEVEAAILEHPDVLSCAVIGLPEDDLGNYVHAIVQLTPGAWPNEDELLAFVGQRVVRYKRPRSFEIVAWDVRDDAGKTRRTALRDERL